MTDDLQVVRHHAMQMPLTRALVKTKRKTVKTKRKPKESICLIRLREWLCDTVNFAPYAQRMCIVVESVAARPGQGVTSMFRFGYGAGSIIGLIYGLQLDTKLKLVPSTVWKKHILADFKVHDKKAAIEYATRQYPNIPLIPYKCRSPSDGIADAICLAAYGRLVLAGVV